MYVNSHPQTFKAFRVTRSSAAVFATNLSKLVWEPRITQIDKPLHWECISGQSQPSLAWLSLKIFVASITAEYVPAHLISQYYTPLHRDIFGPDLSLDKSTNVTSLVSSSREHGTQAENTRGEVAICAGVLNLSQIGPTRLIESTSNVYTRSGM